MNTKKDKMRMCTLCGKLDKNLKVCAGCQSVHYCNQACQRADWKSHKGNCKNTAQSKIFLENLPTVHSEFFSLLCKVADVCLVKYNTSGVYVNFVSEPHFSASIKAICNLEIAHEIMEAGYHELGKKVIQNLDCFHSYKGSFRMLFNHGGSMFVYEVPALNEKLDKESARQVEEADSIFVKILDGLCLITTKNNIAVIKKF